MAIKKGIDVSRWNPANIDWNWLRDNGYSFAFVKASEGLLYPKKLIEMSVVHAENAKAAGLQVGYYHYATPNATSGLAEAQYFIDVVNKYFPEPDLELALDFEEPVLTLNKEQSRAWVETFLRNIIEADFKPLLYGGAFYFDAKIAYPNELEMLAPLWLARYPKVPDLSKKPTQLPKSYSDVLMWQYTDKEPIRTTDGKEIKVDGNVRYD